MNDPSLTTESRFQLTDILPVLQMNARLIAISTAAAFVVAALGTFLTTPLYRATALLQLIPSSAQEVQVEEVIDMDARGFQEIERFYRTQLQLMRTRTTAVEVLRRYTELGFTDLDPEAGGVATLRGMLTVFPRERSQLIELSITHPDPEKAAVLATLYAKAYVDANLESRREASREAKRWLEAKIEEYEAKVSSTQAQLVELRRTSDLADVEEAVTALSARMTEVDKRYGAVSTEAVLLATRLESFRRLLAQGRHVELAGLLDTPTLQTLARLHAEARSEHATLSARYGPRHSRYRESEARLERVLDELRAEVRQALEAEQARLDLLTGQETALLSQIEGTKTELLDRGSKRASYDLLKLELERSESFLKRLSKRSDELDLSARTQLNNAQLRQEAQVPGQPVSPNLPLNLALGLLSGLAAGVAFALLRFTIDDSISTPSELTTYIGLPSLGVIPRVPEADQADNDLYTFHKPRSLVAEAARGLRTLLAMDPSGVPIRKLLVTSSVASEGKTSTCVRIAVAFAQFGQRVLLVEADHRRARIHRVFGIRNDEGVMDLLLHGGSIDRAVRATEVPNVWALTLGSHTEDASKLLASEAMDELLDQLSERFDLVIVDTPPAATLTEAVTLSRRVDGVLLVVRSGAVSRTVIRHTVERFQKVNARFVGAVLNNVSAGPGSGPYSYLYGYRYPYYSSKYYQEDPDTDEKDAVAK